MAWAGASKFKGKSGDLLLVPGPDGDISKVLLGVESDEDLWGYAALATKLPPGRQQLVSYQGRMASLGCNHTWHE